MDDSATIATYYRLDPAQPAPVLLGGHRAFAAIDKREPARRLLAVQAKPDTPPRARALLRLGQGALANAMVPLDHGPGRDPSGQESWFILTGMPPGPPLSGGAGAWTEMEAMTCLLQPAATALDALTQRGVTHRAIRPDNVFRRGPGEPVTLGPFWATPPASLQPAAFEPPYAAMCLPAGRGDGMIADDIYALGVLLLWCVLGRPAWADDATLLPRKLEHGSLAALAGSASMSSGFYELLRLMLAEDPEHRPAPAILMAPDQARTRRLATRPPVRAQQPLELGSHVIWTARELAYGLATQPEHGMALLRGGRVDRWLRRSLGDGQLAVSLEEAVVAAARDADGDETSQQAVVVLRATAVLDPLAPMAWRGILFFPDGLGSALAAAQAANQPAVAAALEEVVAQDAITQWLGLQARRRDAASLKQEARDWRGWLTTRGPMGGVRRLTYALNPLLACFSPLLAGRLVGRLQDLLPALDEAASRADRKRPPIDAHIAAFVAARADTTLTADIGHIEGFNSVPERLSVLRLFARLQARLHPAPLPGLAGWLLESGLINLELWRNLHTRKALTAKLAEEAAAGQIGAMLLLAQDEPAQHADRAGAEQAAERAADIAAELAALAVSGPRRLRAAQKMGHDIATGAALAALLGGAIMLGFTL